MRQETQWKRTVVRERHIAEKYCATCFRDNRTMSFRNTFARYLASHLRNYSAGFILYECERSCGFAARCPRRIYCPTRHEFSRQKINIQRRATMLRAGKLFALKLTSSRHIPIEKRSASTLLCLSKRYSCSCKVPHARPETLRNTAPLVVIAVCRTRLRKLREASWDAWIGNNWR